ncbi:MAG: A/G-specific adenine glycosylase [Puniceicoccaceae bacterium]
MPTQPTSSPSDQLLEWYDQHRRFLPWREQPTLYRTVVSEFMLQQTQVKSMLPYFDRWMAVFPDFETLSRADEGAVVKLWEGLGYYRRARSLWKLAQQWVAAEPKPTSAAQWLEYPGVGPYMAAAIASIDFGERTVVVDGNVVRVIARLRKIETRFPNAAAAVKAVRPLAQELIPADRPGDFNQALMELGAMVCRPKSPTCLLCPWLSHCESVSSGLAEQLPNIQKTRIKKVTIPRLLVMDFTSGRILLQEGALHGRLDGLYELPVCQSPIPRNWKPIATIRRGISNQQITEPVFQLDPQQWRQHLAHKKTEPEWIPFQNLEQVPLSGPHRKWISGFLASGAGSC